MPTRRGFLGRMWLALGGVALVEYIWLGFEFLKPPRESAETVTPTLEDAYLWCTSSVSGDGGAKAASS